VVPIKKEVEMSFIKRHLEDQEAALREVHDVLVEAGSLRVDEVTDELCNGSNGVEAAYKLASRKIARGEIDISGSSRKAYLALIEREYWVNW
jgi:ubiquinone/menaquinone biosynthesis C-methylase UbiE